MPLGGGVVADVEGEAELGGVGSAGGLGGPAFRPEGSPPGTGPPVPGCDGVGDGDEVSVVVGGPVPVGGCGGRDRPGGTDAGIGEVAGVEGVDVEGVGTAVVVGVGVVGTAVVDGALVVGQGRLSLPACSNQW